MEKDCGVEKLVCLDDDTFIRPSSVQAITPRMFGCDIHLASGPDRKAEKVFVQIDSIKAATLLGLVQTNA